MPEQKKQCPEFPYFGAWYPDATCIDGYLWDLDKYENGMLYGGGEEPCPFCNAQLIIDDADPEEREEVRKNIQSLHEKYGYA